MNIYGLKNCDKCRSALKAFKHAGHMVTFIDVRVDGISLDILSKFYKEFGNELINNRSTTWRELPEDDRKLNPLDLLLKYPTVMKRPVIDNNGNLQLGWNKLTEKMLLS